MKEEIRQILEAGGVLAKKEDYKMPDTPQQMPPLTFEQLKELLAISNKPSYTEQKAMDQEEERDRRARVRGAIEGNAEMLTRWNKQHNCTHCRDKQTGELVNRGAGQWITGGQSHGNGTITLQCLRCNTVWRWQATPQELDTAATVGLANYPPPSIERCLNRDDFIEERPIPIDIPALLKANGLKG